MTNIANIFTSVDFESLPQRKHKPIDQLKRRHNGKFDYAQFIGWDGEGITNPDGTHHYVLFANSMGHKIWALPANDGTFQTGCSSAHCFAALIETARNNPKAIHVIYYGSYDFNMLLRDVPRDALERLRHGLKAYYLQYSIQVRFGKSLWIKDKNTKISVMLWDVGSFFQQSFVKALQTWQVDTPWLDEIIAMKQLRSTFTARDMQRIEQYCDHELESLVLLMGQFHKSLAQCDIRISRWHGPGAIANALYSQHSIKRHKKDCSDDVNTAAQYAYGGGRIELIKQGHYNGNIYNYDIRSCYPHAIANLPSLRNATWQHHTGSTGTEIRELSLYRVRWHFKNRSPFYPLRHRHSNGSVCYPQTGVSTWCWTPEYKLLERYYPGQYEVLESYLWNGNSDTIERPFGWVADMYAQRMEWKAKGYGAERILKLGLNSLYGKMIQQLGWSDDRLPAWHQLEWGGYVTSAARARLYEAAHGSNRVVSFETDGILCTEPLDVELSNDLGGWELCTYSSLTYVQTGFYWMGNKVRYRGFDPNSVTRDAVINGWRRNESTVGASLTRHIGLAYAAHNNRWDQWGNWITAPRQLDIGTASNKRIRNCGDSCPTCREGSTLLSDGLHDTRPYPEIITEPSAIYPLAWKPDGLPQWKIDAIAHNNELTDYYTGRYG